MDHVRVLSAFDGLPIPRLVVDKTLGAAFIGRCIPVIRVASLSQRRVRRKYRRSCVLVQILLKMLGSLLYNIGCTGSRVSKRSLSISRRRTVCG